MINHMLAITSPEDNRDLNQPVASDIQSESDDRAQSKSDGRVIGESGRTASSVTETSEGEEMTSPLLQVNSEPRCEFDVEKSEIIEDFWKSYEVGGNSKQGKRKKNGL